MCTAGPGPLSIDGVLTECERQEFRPVLWLASVIDPAGIDAESAN
jgi:hypothetical protein